MIRNGASTPRVIATAAAGLTLAALLLSCFDEKGTTSSQISAPAGAAEALQTSGPGDCAPGGIKARFSPFTVSTTDGSVVTSVCVRAGAQKYQLRASTACYLVEGIGRTRATVRRIGPSTSCDEILYAVFYTSTSPTPTPSVTPTPTPTPTATPTPTPTPTPTGTPTPPPQGTPTPTPTPT